MRLSCSHLHPILLLSLLAACPSKDGVDKTTEDSSITDGTATATESSGEPSTGEPTSATESGLPAECELSDPSVSSQVEVIVEGWPEPPPPGSYNFDVECTIDDVSVDAGIVSTALTCDVDGSMLPALVQMPEAPEGEVAWEAGKAVRLIAYDYFTDPGDRERLFQLRAAADDALLAAAMESPYGTWHSMVFAPLTFAYEYACGPMNSDDRVPLRVDLGIPNGATVSVFAHQRGQLPIDASQTYAIDVEEATTSWSGHNSEYFQVFVRRVRTGG